MARLVAVGDNTLDVYLDQLLDYPGGNALNVAVFAARLGATSAYLGCVGSDEHGQRLLACLAEEGVAAGHCRTLPGPNGWACVDRIDGERVFLGSDPGVCRQLRLSAEDLAYLATFPLAHSSLYSGLEQQLEAVRNASGCLSFDFSDNWEEFDWQALIAHVDIAFFSAAALNREQALALAQAMRARGPTIVVLTRGAEGAIAVDAQGVHEQASLPCTLVDSMGAGDGFVAAFLLAWQDGHGLPECLAQGAGYAAQVCGWPGGFGHGRAITAARARQLKQALNAQG
ncbi:PfkB family carbohydrate kinase [Pseudomonas sp. RIT-PI-S]|uniref:PfkB family carbohydrate kinase n=1 Tax=Pseudomonas sp. RIT-PI-S TaxID=3035295 RepID=UPI0021DA8B28|nr:PfkB family carbohydrate kinase [Pseudomonas sp. RIT-PI-S]